jgi:tripartite-type tricarboxylate transporter receptor subunit TctC
VDAKCDIPLKFGLDNIATAFVGCPLDQGTVMIKVTRRTALAALSTFMLRPAFAVSLWPNRPINLLTGYAPGGSTDTLTRIVAEALSRRLGQPVVVEAKSGAAGTLAAGQVARASPDGYTLLVVASGFATTAAIYRKLPYRPVEDFSIIGMVTEFPFVVATYGDHPIRTISELISVARSGKRRLAYGTSGAGSNQHLAIELLAKMANAQFQHVPYRGGTPAIIDLVGKQLDFVVDPPTGFIEFFKDGRLRALAVTSETRDPDLRDVPTIGESGVPGYAVTAWHGLVAPAGLPASVMDRISAELASTLVDPVVVDRLKALKLSPRRSSPDEFKARIEADIMKWSDVVAATNIERI